MHTRMLWQWNRWLRGRGANQAVAIAARRLCEVADRFLMEQRAYEGRNVPTFSPVALDVD